jgi:RNA polymerase sigma-70 factor (ECF subfamily)
MEEWSGQLTQVATCAIAKCAGLPHFGSARLLRRAGRMPNTKLEPMRKGNSAEETALLQALLGASTPDGERQASQRELVRRYERLIDSCVRNVLRRYGVTFQAGDVHDLVNDVWVMLLRDDMRKLRQYDPQRGVRLASFIGMIATNTTIDHLRSQKAETRSLDSELEEGATMLDAGACELPRDTVEEQQHAELARAAFQRLSRDEQAFVVDVFHEERSPEELARTLGVSTGTIYSRKVKLRAKLAGIVASLEGAA